MTVPISVPSVTAGRQPFEFVIVELVGIVGRRQLGAVDQEQRAAQRIGGVRSPIPSRRSRSRPGMLSGRLHREVRVASLFGARATQRGAVGETDLGFVGTDVDDEFAADAMRLWRPADDEIHQVSIY